MDTYHYWIQHFPGVSLTLVECNGELVVCAFGEDIKFIKLFLRQHNRNAHLVKSREPLQFVVKQLREYFSGERKQFQIPVQLIGTSFQRNVWAALKKIKYGETQSYGALAASLGNPRLARAVGAACGANPVAIIVPCHRVIGASGKLVGYGGGVEMKQTLLKMEGNLLI